jgi:sodium transport system ATP-binding protein
MILEVNGLKKTFKMSKKQQKIDRTTDKIKVAVSDVSFAAHPGEILGILGANGAGKTTTLRILAAIIKADEGTALLDGKNINDDISAYRKKIGFLTSELKQEEFFTPNYLYDFFSNLYGMEPEESQARKQELFEKFGIDKFAEVKVADLSTGMKQKVSLVMSIVHNPEIIIFDEPTNGLDIITERIVVDFLRELRAQGKCIIISSHIFSLIEKICDRVVIIIDGKAVKCDSLENVMNDQSLEDSFFKIYEEMEGNVNE